MFYPATQPVTFSASC